MTPPTTLAEVARWLDAHPGTTLTLHAVAGSYFVRLDTYDMRVGRGARLTIADAFADACAALERGTPRAARTRKGRACGRRRI